MLEKNVRKPHLQAGLLIFLCFLLTATGWLIWNYHVLEYMTAESSNIFTMVLGYLFQAAGIGIFAFVLRYRPRLAGSVFYISAGLHMAFMIPALICTDVTAVIATGILMELFCGIIAGYYLYYLSVKVSKNHRARVFGFGYGLSTLMSWLLRLADGGKLYFSEKILFVCAVMTAYVMYLASRNPAFSGCGYTEISDCTEETEDRSISEKHLCIGVLVFLMGLAINCGFSFCPLVAGETVNVEFTRLVYAASLIIAGIVTDRDRMSGAIFALTTLVFPFIILSLRGTVTVSMVFWMLSYAAFGFYSVYRIVLFADTDIVYLSGFGLLVGRISDAAGEAVCLALNDRLILYVGITAALCVAAIFAFFRVYQILYIQIPEPRISPEEKFLTFSVNHDFSSREREIFRLILEDKTNCEIADSLCISENTVKFHVRNLLKKTACKNRKDLVAAFIASEPDKKRAAEVWHPVSGIKT